MLRSEADGVVCPCERGTRLRVNFKAELEIMLMHDKLDLLREGQWRELLAMQSEQLKLLRGLPHADASRGNGEDSG